MKETNKMKEIKDNFSKQSDSYLRFRPTYPQNLYELLLSHVTTRNRCLDCGTGNGQVAAELAEHFNEVYATDISQKQIENAIKKSNITYILSRAEKTDFPDNYFDLITVGQALHWFDLEAFENEVRRVAKKGGVLGTWGYGLLKVDPAIDPVIEDFYLNKVGPYWDQERDHIDSGYRSIQFDFEEIDVDQTFSIEEERSLDQLQGFFNSWSSVQHYMHKNQGDDPVEPLMAQIRSVWGQSVTQRVTYPVFIRLWRVT